jgi:hypothetical protein
MKTGADLSLLCFMSICVAIFFKAHGFSPNSVHFPAFTFLLLSYAILLLRTARYQFFTAMLFSNLLVTLGVSFVFMFGPQGQMYKYVTGYAAIALVLLLISIAEHERTGN